MWTAGEITRLVESDKIGWPKRSTTCQLRPLGNPVLNTVCIPPNTDAIAPRVTVVALAKEARALKLMDRSDGGAKTGSYYRRGNSFPIDQVEPHAIDLIVARRSLITLEPTSRFINQRRPRDVQNNWHERRG